MGCFLPTREKTHTHEVGMGIWWGMGVGINADTPGYTHAHP
jgi:hypothetical protein